MEEDQLLRAFAMLIGLAGCLTGGVICSRLFTPKRTVVEEAHDSTSRIEALEELAAERGGLGSIAELDDATIAEMKALGLYDVFTEAEANPSLTKKAD